VYALVAVVALLSTKPVLNMISPGQIMNTSFDPLHLVSTYGAFGAVGRERYEIVIRGTRDETIGPDTVWLEYELECKPGDLTRRPCIVSPYQERLAWQMWFAAMSSIDRQPWLQRFLRKLLEGDRDALGLLARNPFGDRPPAWIKADLYRYQFTDPGENGGWWRREFRRIYAPPVRAP